VEELATIAFKPSRGSKELTHDALRKITRQQRGELQGFSTAAVGDIMLLKLS
jgi:hypothetical protein